MERFEHLAMVAFLILGLAMVRLMTNMTSLLAKDSIAEEIERDYGKDRAKELETKYDVANVEFYWVHTMFVFITFFTTILFWWTCYPINDLTYFPDENWNLFTYLLFLTVPFLFFMICEIIAPQDHAGKQVDLKAYYYRFHRVILGLAWLLQVGLLANLFVFFQGELYSMKVLGRVIMLAVMLPMVFFKNHRIHEIGMTIFFVGFIYTIIKYHIFAAI